MAGLTYTTAEFNTIITMLGCLCATVQSATGAYAAYKTMIFKSGLGKTGIIVTGSLDNTLIKHEYDHLETSRLDPHTRPPGSHGPIVAQVIPKSTGRV